uniref:EF-hand domain family member D2 n=2 Tax=Telluraves TaxID=3073808 RepID=A0A8D0EQM0_STROC
MLRGSRQVGAVTWGCHGEVAVAALGGLVIPTAQQAGVCQTPGSWASCRLHQEEGGSWPRGEGGSGACVCSGSRPRESAAGLAASWGFLLPSAARKQKRSWVMYDAGKDGFIDLMELKLMMEKLGAPQTHLGLKNMIKEVDEDLDSKLSFREFLLIFRKAAAGELQEDSGLHALARLSEIDVSTEGVKGAKSFFEAKVQAIHDASRFEEEIKAEQEEKKKQAEELKQRKAAFKELQSTFKQ